MEKRDFILQIEKLSFGWESEHLFRAISVSVQNPAVICLTGANGSGKTTLLKILSGMIPHFAVGKIMAGDVHIFGKSIVSNPPRTFFPNLAFLPDSQIELFFFMKNLSEELTIIQATLRLTNELIERKMAQFSEYFPEFSDFRELPFERMDASQRQLCLLLIFFLQDARLFLIDEMASQLNQQLLQFYHSLKTEQKTVIFVNPQTAKGSDFIWEISGKRLVVK